MPVSSQVIVRPLTESDLGAADLIFRTAFGTFIGLDQPERYGGDSDYVRTRWKADPAAALGAELGGRLVGSNFAARWGSVGFFGPLTVAPRNWDSAIGQRLLDATMELFAEWGTGHLGLFTFPNSAKHLSLYQRYGFWPRFLTAIMSMPITPPGDASAPGAGTAPGALLSQLPPAGRDSALRAIGELTDAVYPGLDVRREIGAIQDQGLGEVVLVEDAADLQAVAVCHLGAGSEAGHGTCYVKFGAVRPGPQASRMFGLLLDASAALAADRGATTLAAGVSAACERAWAAMAARGFRSRTIGVTMHRPNDSGYHAPGNYVIDDWR
jgi:GNAT superfamily N-acetyltransferase